MIDAKPNELYATRNSKHLVLIIARNGDLVRGVFVQAGHWTRPGGVFEGFWFADGMSSHGQLSNLDLPGPALDLDVAGLIAEMQKSCQPTVWDILEAVSRAVLERIQHP